MAHSVMGEVVIEVGDEGVGVLTLDAPERRNALTPELVSDIVAAADWLESREDVNVVIVTGAGSAFCAGAALSELDSANTSVLQGMYRAFLRIHDLRKPTIAAVNGPAVGAGLNLAMACDLRVVSDDAVLDSRFLRLGLHPGGGASWLLRRVAGEELAAAMLLFGLRLKGRECVDKRLAWDCVPTAELISTARHLAAQAASAPSELTALTKQTLKETWGLSHGDTLEVELERQAWTATQPWYALSRAASRTPERGER
ncbi:enoyl-CoA hydratase-related protein [Spirillospora sp. CA-255316]